MAKMAPPTHAPHAPYGTRLTPHAGLVPSRPMQAWYRLTPMQAWYRLSCSPWCLSHTTGRRAELELTHVNEKYKNQKAGTSYLERRNRVEKKKEKRETSVTAVWGGGCAARCATRAGKAHLIGACNSDAVPKITFFLI